MTVYFVDMRHHYQSYEDWYTLAQLSGYPIVYTDEVLIHSDNVYICNHFGAISLPGIPQETTAKIILWQLEWIKPEEFQQYDRPHEIWVSDKWYCAYLTAGGVQNVRYVPLGSHERLFGYYVDSNRNNAKRVRQSGFASYPTTHEIALMMYRQPNRRDGAIAQMRDREHINIAPDGWGSERHAILQAVRAMVHIHQHDAFPVVAPLRFALAAAYSLPMITEAVNDAGIFGQSHLLMSDYAFLPEFVASWLHDPCTQMLPDYGRALHGLLCRDYTFRRCVEAAL